MAKCGCSGNSCSCKIVAGRGTRVTGSGNLNNPYTIDAFPMSLTVQDTPSINLTLTGTGLLSDPWTITGELTDDFLSGYWLRWVGTQAEYDALVTYDDQTMYIIIEA